MTLDSWSLSVYTLKTVGLDLCADPEGRSLSAPTPVSQAAASSAGRLLQSSQGFCRQNGDNPATVKSEEEAQLTQCALAQLLRPCLRATAVHSVPSHLARWPFMGTLLPGSGLMVLASSESS